MSAPAIPRNPAEIMRDEMVMRPRIAAVLADGPKTIPAIAETSPAKRRNSGAKHTDTTTHSTTIVTAVQARLPGVSPTNENGAASAAAIGG